MSAYYVWVVALIAGYEGRIIQGMVTKGYTVSAASGDTPTLTTKEGPSSVIALKIEKTPSVTAKEIYDDAVLILTSIDAKYYSLIVSEASVQTMWCASNIVLPPITETKTKSVDKKSN